MARTGQVEIAADFSEMGYSMGIISGMAKTVKTKRYLSDVIEYVHGELAQEFDDHMDFVRTAAPKRFSHVYEWDTEGGKTVERQQLWDHKLLGAGGRRNATFIWRASVKPIPNPYERAQDPDDPMSKVPRENIDRLSKRKYFFYWKAPVMEYNTPVNIAPVFARALFIPTGDSSNPFVFANEYRNLQPGSAESTGAFTTEWTNWWAGAQTSFDDHTSEALASEVASVEQGIRSGQRSRTKTVSIGVTADYAAAFESGETWAEEYLMKKAAARRKRRRI